MGNGNTTISGSRKRAAALKALDARELLQGKLPDALKTMTNTQIGRMQTVLDAAVVNPVVMREHEDARRRSIVPAGKPGGNYEGGYHNGVPVIRDKNQLRRADRIFEQQIPISENDKRIRLEHGKLLTSNAFALTTNNPDEARFMENLQKDIVAAGLWLRFEPQRVRDPEEPSRWIIDPRSFEVWISFGPMGPEVPTKTGVIDRASLLGTQSIGASYYESVHKGPYMRQLEDFMSKLFNQIQDGHQENMRQDGVRSTAAPLVPTIADAIGGANFPDPKGWEKAWELYHYAWKQRLQGNVLGATGTLIVAAMLTQQLAERLDKYINNTVSGAETVVKVALVVVTITSIIDSVMLFRGIGTALLKRYIMRGATAEIRLAAKSGTPKPAPPPYKGPEAYQRTNYAGKEAASNPTKAAKKFDPKATKVTDAGVGDFIDVAEADWRRRGEGWMKEMFDYLLKNPNAPLAEKIAMNDKLSAKWGFNPHNF